ncbi:MAG TPA: hypothetical protein VGD88_08620 [Opitutaceae bacterium]
MKPFLQGRKTLAEAALRPAVPALTAPTVRLASRPGAAPHAHTEGAQVEVVKQGDKVTRLIVTCACGERIEIDCLYPAGV